MQGKNNGGQRGHWGKRGGDTLKYVMKIPYGNHYPVS